MRGLFLLALLTLFCGSAGAQTPRINFSRISLHDSLSQSSINAIVQDGTGLMWFATQGGLNRFDGYDFTVFRHDPDDPRSISHTFAWCLYLDGDGNLWIGTDGGGLNRWEPETDSYVHWRHDPADERSLGNDRVRVLYEDREGRFWVGTEMGLNLFDRESQTFTRWLHDPEDPESLANDRVRAIFEDRQGALWIGTDGGGLSLLDVERSSFTSFRHDPEDPESLSEDRVKAIFEDGEGRLWIGTYEGGLNRLDRSTGRFLRFASDPEEAGSISHNRVRAIFEDESGALWIGTDGGLDRWVQETGSFVHYRNDPSDPNSLGDDRVMSLFQDQGGVVWVGTQGGISKWNARVNAFPHYRRQPADAMTLSSDTVTTLHEDRKGGVWIGTYGGGLNWLDRRQGRFLHYRHDPEDPGSLGDDRVMSLLVDRGGTLWVGTFTAGLARFDAASEHFARFQHDEADRGSLSANGVTTILEDKQDRLWVGTYRGGLNLLDRGTGNFVRIRHDPEDPDSLASDAVMVLAEDSRGFLWVGTDGAGLDRLDPETGAVRHFRHDPEDETSLGSDSVWSVHEGGNGTLWIGTQGGGLSRWDARDRQADRAVFRRYLERDGLPDAFIYGILEDEWGRLWLSTNRGLSCFEPGTETFTNYDRTDGLQSDEFNFGAYHRAGSGEMFFGGDNGFNAFRPTAIRGNEHVPPVMLTSIRKLNEPMPLETSVWEAKSIELGHRDSMVSFEFAALDYSAPEKNRYAYKLEGFDRDWNDLGTLRRATYTNLDPGEYVLRIRGSNDDGVWNEAGTNLKIKVIPPPWRTVWAYALYTLAALGLLLWFLQVQRRKLRREAEYSRKLEKDVEARTRKLAEQNAKLEDVNSRLEDASITDSLTGLRNRRYLLTYLKSDIALVHRRYEGMKNEAGAKTRENADFLFLMVDLDRFKEINDNHGHDVGDSALVEVRSALRDACRDSDTIIRWGGDEFLIVCRDMDRDMAESLAERIRESISLRGVSAPSGEALGLSCSIGFACYPFLPARPTLVSWEKVLTIADRALYLAKERGRNAWVGISGTGRIPPRDLIRRLVADAEGTQAEGLVTIRSSLETSERSAAGQG